MVYYQAIERRGFEHDPSRTARSVVIGALYTAPAATFVYNLVDKVGNKNLITLHPDFTFSNIDKLLSPVTSVS